MMRPASTSNVKHHLNYDFGDQGHVKRLRGHMGVVPVGRVSGYAVGIPHGVPEVHHGSEGPGLGVVSAGDAHIEPREQVQLPVKVPEADYRRVPFHPFMF